MNRHLPGSRLGQLYLGAVIVAGSSVALLSAKNVYTREVWSDWLVLAVLTLLTGSFTVRVPGLLARISVSMLRICLGSDIWPFCRHCYRRS